MSPEKQLKTPSAPNMDDEFYRVSGETCRTVVAIIDTLSTRGAFKGEELEAIANVRRNCVNLVQMAESRDNAKES